MDLFSQSNAGLVLHRSLLSAALLHTFRPTVGHLNAMLLSRFAKVMAVWEGLIGKAISIAPRTRTFPDSVGGSDSGYLRLDHGLHRRENSRLTAGTLTITVAPDPTCGFDANEDVVTCPSSKRCSWESGRIDNVFCDLRYIRTTCLDRTDALDPDLCDLDCIEDANTLLW